MSDTAQTIALLTPMIVAIFAGLKWWVERRDAIRKAERETATLALSESEATKTIRTLNRQKEQLEDLNEQLNDRNDALRRELHEALMDLADCCGGRRSPRDAT